MAVAGKTAFAAFIAHLHLEALAPVALAGLITTDERAAVLALAEAWNAFLRLPIEHPDDTAEFRHLIHAAQDKVLGRVGRRQINGNDEAS